MFVYDCQLDQRCLKWKHYFVAICTNRLIYNWQALLLCRNLFDFFLKLNNTWQSECYCKRYIHISVGGLTCSSLVIDIISRMVYCYISLYFISINLAIRSTYLYFIGTAQNNTFLLKRLKSRKGWIIRHFCSMQHLTWKKWLKDMEVNRISKPLWL